MTVNVGLVGLGMMGATHLRAWGTIRPTEVVAICDLLPERLEGDLSKTLGNIDTGASGEKDFSNIEKYKSYPALLRKDEVDVVDLCVPTFLHAKMAIQALKAGKHVFCEKPMALNVRQGVKMIKAAEEAHRLLMIGHCLRFHPEYLMLKDMLDTGRYGRVRSANFRRFSSKPTWSWEDWFSDTSRSGSVALDLHIHDADTVQWFFGPPERVSSQGASDGSGGFDHIITQYQYDEVPVVVAEAGWSFPSTYRFWMGATIVFESAAVEFNSLNSPTLTVYDEKSGTSTNPSVPTADPYTEELKYFADCVASGTPSERVTPSDAIRAVALVEAEMRSARSRRPVTVKF